MLTDILKCLNTIRPDHDKVEIRCIRGRGGAILTGVFDWEHRKEIPAAVAPYSDWAGIYFCLNAPNLPATNRLDHGTAVKDIHISRRLVFMLDFDPVRFGPDGKLLREPVLDENGQPVLDADGNPRTRKLEISTTDEEKARGLERAQNCRADLMGLGWPEPILADSGNGYHLLLYAQLMCIDGKDVAADFDAVYDVLAKKFGDDQVRIDIKVKNPSRICKLYGTTPRKGPNTGERPWRRSGLMEGPEDWSSHPVSREMLFAVEELAEASEEAKIPDTPDKGKEISDEEFRSKVKWVWDFLNDNPKAKVLSKSQRDDKGARIDVECPLDMEHSADSGKRQASILILHEYGYDFNCFHDHADARKRGEIMDWAWYKARVEEPVNVEDLEAAGVECLGAMEGEDIPHVEYAGVSEEDKDNWALAAATLDIIREGKGTREGKGGKEETYPLPGHVVDENILNFVVRTLRQFGAKFFVYDAPYLFLPRERAIFKFLKTDAQKLLSRFKLRLVQRHTELVDQNLRLYIFMNGESTHIHKFGCLKDGAVYVCNGRGGMFKITPNDIVEVSVGTDGVYMKNKHLTPWPEFTPEDYRRMRDTLAGFGGRIGDARSVQILQGMLG